MFLLALLLSLSFQPGQSIIVCSVTAGGAPVPGAEVVVAGKTYLTDARGEVQLEVSPGPVELTILTSGFASVTTTVTVPAGQQQRHHLLHPSGSGRDVVGGLLRRLWLDPSRRRTSEGEGEPYPVFQELPRGAGGLVYPERRP